MNFSVCIYLNFGLSQNAPIAELVPSRLLMRNNFLTKVLGVYKIAHFVVGIGLRDTSRRLQMSQFELIGKDVLAVRLQPTILGQSPFPSLSSP